MLQSICRDEVGGLYDCIVSPDLVKDLLGDFYFGGFAFCHQKCLAFCIMYEYIGAALHALKYKSGFDCGASLRIAQSFD